MTLIQGVIPPSHQTWETVVYYFQFFPLLSAAQWITHWYPAGKTSIDSRLNLPGKLAWAIMESPGLVIVLYSVLYLPAELGIDSLPWINWAMATLYIVHYIYRAYLFPLLAPSMSPVHVLPFLLAIVFNTANGISIGGWVAGYGPSNATEWGPWAIPRMEIGMVIWGWSLLGNIFHDDDLREIRRAAGRMQKARAEKEGTKLENVEKIYMVPKNGLFNYVLYPHYFCEWIEWTGYWMIGGWDCVPARTFLINEISTMLPRAIAGKEWYIQKFGAEKIGNRKAVIPGII